MNFDLKFSQYLLIVNYGPKGDRKEKTQEQQNPKMVQFTGSLVGELDLNDVESLKQQSASKDLKRRARRSSFHHTRLNKNQLKHLLRSALPTKRILFNEIGKILIII